MGKMSGKNPFKANTIISILTWRQLKAYGGLFENGNIIAN